MTDELRFDIIYRNGGAIIEPHFCREWDTDGGCYGTNPTHGFSFDEACDQVADWYEQQAKLWRSRQHHEAVWFAKQIAVIEEDAKRSPA